MNKARKIAAKGSGGRCWSVSPGGLRGRLGSPLLFFAIFCKIDQLILFVFRKDFVMRQGLIALPECPFRVNGLCT